VPGSQLFPRTLSSQRLSCSYVSEQVNVLNAFAALPTGVVFLATLGRVAGVDGDGLGLRAEGAYRRFVHVDRVALPSSKSLAVPEIFRKSMILKWWPETGSKRRPNPTLSR